MKFIRNVYFWLVLGSVVVVIGGDALYHDYNPKSKEALRPLRSEELRVNLQPFSDPYLAGFFTAVVLGGFWYGILSKNR